jgi:hypothetical protein
MKGQAAAIEGIFAGIILVSALAIMSEQFYQNSLSLGVEPINIENSVQDLQAIAYNHTTWSSCIASSNTQCIAGILKNFSIAYKLSYLSFTIGNQTISYGSANECKADDYYCFPYNSVRVSNVACLYACGD